MMRAFGIGLFLFERDSPRPSGRWSTANIRKAFRFFEYPGIPRWRGRWASQANSSARNRLVAYYEMLKILIVACTLLEWTAFGQGTTPPDQSDTIRLDVNLIQMHATVLDSSGHAITGLEKSAFQLFVDDVQQPISVFQNYDSPVTAGIVVDNSASMYSKGPEVLAAALSFARASNPYDQMFVVHFSDQVCLGLPPDRTVTGSIPELETALARFTAAGTTALYDAVVKAFSQFRPGNLETKVLLIISDGGDNSSHARLADVLKMARASGYVIYSIGVYDETDHDRNPGVLSQLAEVTGGTAFFPSELKEVTHTCETIAREIRQQYTLGFDGQKDGQYHRIKVTVRDPKYGDLLIRTRAGYFAPKPSEYSAAVN
jgi:Ca-activated chloride channel homolog